MEECFRTLFGRRHHAFEPRYATREMRSGDHFWTSVTAPAEDFADIMAPKYLGDICTRCGTWRPSPSPTQTE